MRSIRVKVFKLCFVINAPQWVVFRHPNLLPLRRTSLRPQHRLQTNQRCAVRTFEEVPCFRPTASGQPELSHAGQDFRLHHFHLTATLLAPKAVATVPSDGHHPLRLDGDLDPSVSRVGLPESLSVWTSCFGATGELRQGRYVKMPAPVPHSHYYGTHPMS